MRGRCLYFLAAFLAAPVVIVAFGNEAVNRRDLLRELFKTGTVAAVLSTNIPSAEAVISSKCTRYIDQCFCDESFDPA